jgi:hypothetical protein
LAEGVLLMGARLYGRWLIGQITVFRERPMQAGRHSSLAWIRTAAESHEVRRFYAKAIVAGWRRAVTSSGGLAARADSCCLNSDFSRDAGA